MTHDSGALLRLASEIDNILSDLDLIAGESREQLTTDPAGVDPERPRLRACGSVLHDFYTAIEDVFELIAEDLNGGVPTSSDWHKRLLRNMSHPIDQLRPAVISRETADLIEDYLGFRHVFRNVYGHRLDWERLKPLIEKLPTAHQRVSDEIGQFQAYLRELAAQLELDQ